MQQLPDLILSCAAFAKFGQLIQQAVYASLTSIGPDRLRG